MGTDGGNSWKTIGVWEGKGGKKTDDFVISGSSWRIHWTLNDTGHRPGYITIFLHRSDGRFVGRAVNAWGEEEGIAEIENDGDFYLDVVSRRAEWCVEVQTRR